MHAMIPCAPMLETTLAGSLPKPAWLAAPRTLWAPWRLEGAALDEGKRDAVRLAVRDQEAAGIDIVTDGEQTRRHFVWGFVEQLEGVDFSKMVTIGIHAAHYGSRAKLGLALASLINEEARELAAVGVDVVQLDEPAFNVYMDEVREWGIAALDKVVEGLPCRTVVHICYGYGIKANTDWKKTLGSEWRQYERTFPLLAKSRIGGVSLECANSHVPMSLLGLLGDKDVLVDAIDVASDRVETPEEVAAVIREAMRYVKPSQIYPCTNCGMVPLDRDLARAKLHALGAGAALVRRELPA